MRKELLFGLSTIALLFTACKKQEGLAGQAENTQKLANAGGVHPIPIVSPALFFLDDITVGRGGSSAVLYKTDNLLAYQPTTTKVKEFTNETTVLKDFLAYGGAWEYNTNTDEILTNNGSSLCKLSTKTLKLSKTDLSGNASKLGNRIKISPDNNKVFGLNGYFGTAIWSMNMDGTNSATIADNTKQLTNLDIDFVNSKIYTLDEVSNSIYVTDLDGKNSKKIASIPVGDEVRSQYFPIIKVDPYEKKLYISTHSAYDKTEKKFRLWSLTTAGQDFKKIFEATDPESGSVFSFDLWVGSKTLFYSLYQNLPKYPISLVGKMNVDGTARKDFFATKHPIKSVLVALPKGEI